MARIKTYFKQAIFNPLKALLLDWQFMMRLVGFGAFLYGIQTMVERRQDQGVDLFIKVEDNSRSDDSTNKFSKTLGHEKKLDMVLKQLQDEKINP